MLWDMGKELRAITDSRKLFYDVYRLTELNTTFKYTLNQQIIRAAISVGSNVVEGRRRSHKEFCRFLDISIGSCSEVQYQLSLYSCDTKELNNLCDKIIGQLINLKKYTKEYIKAHITKP